MSSPLTFTHSPNEPIFIGFAGRMGSGKTSAAQYLSSRYAFQYTRYSLVLQGWLKEEEADRRRLQQLGWDIMSGGLQAELNSRLIAGLDRSQSAAIDGLRHHVDFDSMSSTFGASFLLVFLEAAQEFRFERLRNRFQDFEGFRAADSHAVELQIGKLQPLASVAMRNEGSLQDLYSQLDVWLLMGRVED